MNKTLFGIALVIGGATQPPPLVIEPAPAPPLHSIIPVPAAIALSVTEQLVIDSGTFVVVDRGVSPEVKAVGQYLVQMLWPSASPNLVNWSGDQPARVGKHIRLIVETGRLELGDEGYDLGIRSDGVTLRARTPAGLFHGVQTIRQLLPHSVEHPAMVDRKLWLPTGNITDTPRFEWRGMMLDVSRHFLPPADVKKFVDAMALYKLNRLHLHLSDDQGWRIEIKSRPKLTAIGGSTKVGGGPGGFYTQEEYRNLVAYAASRFITVVPEIDMPAHTNAALASYPELNCDKIAPPLYTGISVGFSALCVDSAAVLRFVKDVVREISAMTPGNYFHVGGDEVKKLTHAQYIRFIESVQQVVNANEKRMIGWAEISPAALVPGTIVQNWIRDSSFVHAARGGKIIISPSTRAYLDMKYDSTTILGQNWAAYIEVKDAYDWDPATFIPGVPEASILGVEGPLWSETTMTREDYELLAFPRLIALAEVGWSQSALRKWEDFRIRLGAHAKRQAALGLNFYRSSQVPWVH
ncbi:MAG: family 20 glycosylhydrolase [Gemmatimonadaceae bacterium]|nr:family 20 glycosylhydrolase [Gemmatimonadaceae bacterium]